MPKIQRCYKDSSHKNYPFPKDPFFAGLKSTLDLDLERFTWRLNKHLPYSPRTFLYTIKIKGSSKSQHS